MWQLRLIIILIGLACIALVYLLSRQRKVKRAIHRKDEPSLEGVEGIQLPAETDTRRERVPTAAAGTQGDSQAAAASSPQPATPSRQLIVVLHVAGHDALQFDGGRVLAALQANGLQYGPMHVFHRLAKADGATPVFSVANMVEPGELQPEALGQQQVAGLTLFLVLPGPADAMGACADMLATARALAVQLRGEVQNENHTSFSVEDAQRIRQRVLEFQTSA